VGSVVTPDFKSKQRPRKKAKPVGQVHAYNDECPSCVRELKAARTWKDGRVSALGVIKGWVVARKKGAAPFLITWREWRLLPYA
jgi:hypothetical protein